MLDVLHHHDLHLVKEVDGQEEETIAQDGLLDEQHIATGILEHPVHGSIVGHHHPVIHDEANLFLLHPLRAIDVGRLLLEDPIPGIIPGSARQSSSADC